VSYAKTRTCSEDDFDFAQVSYASENTRVFQPDPVIILNRTNQEPRSVFGRQTIYTSQRANGPDVVATGLPVRGVEKVNSQQRTDIVTVLFFTRTKTKSCRPRDSLFTT
jgi:hypothetical protein